MPPPACWASCGWTVIATNTTIDHSKVAGDPLANEAGGLSGAPVLEQSTLVLRRLRSRLRVGALGRRRRHPVRCRCRGQDGGRCRAGAGYS